MKNVTQYNDMVTQKSHNIVNRRHNYQ